MGQVKTRMGQGGRIVVPAEYREALGLHPGDEVILRLEGGEVRLFSAQQAIKRAQGMVRRYIPPNRSLSSELIAERRAEAERE